MGIHLFLMIVVSNSLISSLFRRIFLFFFHFLISIGRVVVFFFFPQSVWYCWMYSNCIRIYPTLFTISRFSFLALYLYQPSITMLIKSLAIFSFKIAMWQYRNCGDLFQMIYSNELDPHWSHRKWIPSTRFTKKRKKKSKHSYSNLKWARVIALFLPILLIQTHPDLKIITQKVKASSNVSNKTRWQSILFSFQLFYF